MKKKPKPRKPPGSLRSVGFAFKLTPAKAAQLRKNAAAAKLTITDWIEATAAASGKGPANDG